MKFPTRLLTTVILLAGGAGISSAEPDSDGSPTSKPTVERVTTAVPFPRGLVMVDGELIALSRGRVRGSGGADTRLDDRAGTLWSIDPAIREPLGEYGDAVKQNASVFAEPTSPPFRLLDRTLPAARDDDNTDRPYCTLRYDPTTEQFFICGFSGVDLNGKSVDPTDAETGYFKKNYTDVIFAFSPGDGVWHEIDRHESSMGAAFPGTDADGELRGYLKGPNNMLVYGRFLLAVGKDNNVMVAFDLTNERPPMVLPLDQLATAGGVIEPRGASGLAATNGQLYVAFRTSGDILRMPVDVWLAGEDFEVEPVAKFQAWNPATGASSNITDIDIDPKGRLYVISAQPAKLFRFLPDPGDVKDFQNGEGAWADLAGETNNPRMKSENVLVHDGEVFVTSGDAYRDDGLGGAIYVVGPTD